MSETTITFTIAGDLVLSLRKRLRLAFPKKAFAATTSVVVHVAEQEVTFSLPGAAVVLVALTVGTGTITLPWRQFLPVLREPFQPGGQVSFAFAQGEFTLDQVKSRSKSIVVGASGTAVGGDVGGSAPGSRTATGGAVGAPLLEAYLRPRSYGIQETLANRGLLRQQIQA